MEDPCYCLKWASKRDSTWEMSSSLAHPNDEPDKQLNPRSVDFSRRITEENHL